MGHPYSTLRVGGIYARFENHHIGRVCVLAGVSLVQFVIVLGSSVVSPAICGNIVTSSVNVRLMHFPKFFKIFQTDKYLKSICLIDFTYKNWLMLSLNPANACTHLEI